MQWMSLLSFAMTFKERSIASLLNERTDQGGLTPGQQRIVELPIEDGGLGFLPVKDLAAIARLAALTALPDNAATHHFRESIIEKEGPDLEARLEPKMETPPREIVGNVHVCLLEEVLKPSPST